MRNDIMNKILRMLIVCALAQIQVLYSMDYSRLLNRKQDINLHNAIETNDIQGACKAIDDGANLYTTFIQNRPPIVNSPLIRAVKKGNPKMVELLINKGADPGKDAIGFYPTALFFSAQEGNLDIVNLLLMMGANVNTIAIEHYHETPLHWAARAGHVHIVQKLLEHGANVFVMSYHYDGNYYDCKTPIDLATTQEMFELLVHHAIPRQTKAFAMALHNRLGAESPAHSLPTELFHYIAQQLKEDNNSWLTQELCAASANGCRLKVYDLLKQGINVNKPDYSGKTPLHRAVSSGNVNTACLLLEHSANQWIKDRSGKRPRAFAINMDMQHLLDLWAAPQQKVAFLMALHHRLGAQSPAHILSKELAEYICSFVHAGHF